MSLVDADLLNEWKTAIGREQVERERLEREPLRRYAAALGHRAQALPPLAHWAFFLPLAGDADIGEDGHPRRGGFLPAITLPRRMFAASQMEFVAPLEIGAEAELRSTIADLTHKRGQSGDLVFAQVDRVLSQAGAVRVRERQTYVYRDDGAPTPLPVPAVEAPAGERWEPGPVNLFRFSAATFNGHRIHYDLPYATEVEGYPGLVVHGPFTAARLAGLAERSGPLARFAFRAQAPLFAGAPVYLQHDGEEARAVRCDGVTAMTAQAAYA